MKTSYFRKKELDLPHGMVDIKLKSWEEFVTYIDFIHQTTQSNRQYIWRGQRNSSWRLQSSLQRRLFSHFDDSSRFKSPRKSQLENQDHFLLLSFLGPDENLIQEHLEAFKLSLRGRRGKNPPLLTSDNDWWALGQHYGLHTPLLDWTGSPYVACFFAFQNPGTSDTGQRAIFGLWERDIINAGIDLEQTPRKKKLSPPPIIEFIRPFSDENTRLVNQGGLFSKSPILYDIEGWMEQFLHEKHGSHTLIKIILPDSIREEALRALNRMNINSLSLFPDIQGAADYCNLSLLNYSYKNA